MGDGTNHVTPDLLAILRLQDNAQQLAALSSQWNRSATENAITSEISLNLLGLPSSDVLGGNGFTQPQSHTDQLLEETVNIRKDSAMNGNCVVCESPNAGFHFGATSCAACSAFFRRTIAEKRKYQCRRLGANHLQCPIDQKHRCYCRACRFQKCMSMGMDPTAVQPHRDSNGTKRGNSEGPSQSPEKITVFGNMLPNATVDESLYLNNNRSNTVIEQILEDIALPITTEMNTKLEPVCVKIDSSMPSPDTSESFQFSHNSFNSCGAAQNGSDIPSVEIGSPCFTSSSIQDFSQSECKGNIVELAVEQYRCMLERRRLIYCPSTLRDILAGTLPTPRPVPKFYEKVRADRIRVEIALWIEFIQAIPPFKTLPIDDKIAIIKHLSVSYTIAEKFYISMKHGGLETQRVYHCDLSYTDLADPEKISFECQETAMAGEKQNMDRDTFLKLFIAPFRDGLSEIAGAMFYSGVTDVEFSSLLTLMLFDPAAPGISSCTKKCLRETRERVFNDWFAYYEMRGIDEASQLVGSTMLILPAVQAMIKKTAENFHIVRVFELFEYDKILDEVLAEQ